MSDYQHDEGFMAGIIDAKKNLEPKYRSIKNNFYKVMFGNQPITADDYMMGYCEGYRETRTKIETEKKEEKLLTPRRDWASNYDNY